MDLKKGEMLQQFVLPHRKFPSLKVNYACGGVKKAEFDLRITSLVDFALRETGPDASTGQVVRTGSRYLR